MTPPWLTAFEVAGFTLLFALTGLLILTVIGALRETIRHQLFLARMRRWTDR